MINVPEVLKDILEHRHNYTKNISEIHSILEELLPAVSNIITQEAQHKTRLIVEPNENNSNEYGIYLTVDGSDKKTIVAKYILNGAAVYPVIFKYNYVINDVEDKEDMQAALIAMLREKINPLIDMVIRSTIKGDKEVIS